MTASPTFPMGGPINVPANSTLAANPGNLPDMNDAMRGRYQLLEFAVITKTIMPGGVLTETTIPISFYGTVAPHVPTPLDIAQHGQRAWSIKDVSADVTVQLTNDNVVFYLGKQYRVQAYSDYTVFGYQNFQLILDYTGSGPVI